MKKFAFSLSFFFLLSIKSFSQCEEPSEYKVLLVGDSWAFFMGVDGTINNALSNYGHSGYKFLTNAVVAENGSETDDFLTLEKQNEIQRLLDENPSIEAVHLSIGGNDVLGTWNTGYSETETEALKEEIGARLLQVISFIKSAKPGIKVIYSGYCYTNFEEVITTSFLQNNHPFYSNWANMGFPHNIQLNNILNAFGDMMESYSGIDPDVKYYPASGLMQYVFGQTEPLGVAPGGTYPPHSVPLPEGDINYPSPKIAMRNYGITTDCFHLSPAGYLALVENSTQKFYQKFFMDDLYVLADNTQSGSVSALGTVSSEIKVGNAESDVYASVLSFNTTSMADTTLRKASIFLHKESATGNDIVGSFVVSVKNGNFGASAEVEASDYSSSGNASGSPCSFGANENGKWIRLDLPNELLPYINNSAATQFIITAPFISGSNAKFTNSSDPELAPILNLAYGSPPSGINNINEAKVAIYPNPTNGTVTIESGDLQVSDVQINDMLGKTLLTTNTKTLNISSLSSGLYIVNLHTNAGTVSKRIVKE